MGDSRSERENVLVFKKRAAKQKSADLAREREEDRIRMRTNIAALAMAVLLVGLGWLLVQKLGQSARMQDCLMAGRTNCAPIVVSPRED